MKDLIRPNSSFECNLFVLQTCRLFVFHFQVLRTGVFYKCWVGFFNMSLVSGILGNYSKTFGLTFINDDRDGNL